MWALDKVERKFLNNSQKNSNTQGEPREEDNNNPSSNTIGRDPNKDKYSKGHIVITYTQGLGVSIKKICIKYSIQTHFKGNRTIKEVLVKLRQRSYGQEEWDHLLVSVWEACVQCGIHGRDIQDLWRKIQEHLKEPSPIHA